MRCALALLAIAVGVAADEAPHLRLLPVRDGLPAHHVIEKSSIYGVAKKAGVDLLRPNHSLIVHSYRDGRLFYVFYKTIENGFGKQAYVIQRIKKTERTWKTKDAAPQVRITYQVEVFKTLAGTLKALDQHFGSFGLRDNFKREVVKEYEIGFGEIPGVCEGEKWPFGKGRYSLPQKYGEAEGLYPKVKFTAARKWTLAVSFGRDGRYAIRSDEFGLDAPRALPTIQSTVPAPNPASRDVVLEAAKGAGPIRVGASTPADLAKAFGKPLEVVRVGKGHTNHAVAAALTANFTPEQKVQTIITRSDFAGRTAKGVRLWDGREVVRRAYGEPGAKWSARYWRYPGIVFFFDGLDRVKRIVVTRVR